ncbi:MAG TPA: aldehyde ferredoxin oxidoreductase C-terminal domain-containing protein [Coriobacteriia bacterium]|nr:aldehyde ferredoxin oxidoreductase C-terminal domain-containing protein [Coriobacteriia bacterium]
MLRVDMTNLTVGLEPVPEEWSRYGGRALTDAIVYREVPADADPLGPANVLVFSPGLLGGTTTPNGGRLSVGAKSPLTGGIKESNSGGQAAHALARIGLAGVVVTGAQADKAARYLLVIEADLSARLERVDAWAGLGNYEVADKIAALRPEGDRYATISVGPAGEALARAAGIAVSDPKGYPNRFAGRGGLGAVMGSKGLKGIVISDKGAKSREPANKEEFVAATRRFSAALKEHAVSGTGLPMYGTNVLTNILSEAGGLPTRNFARGTFEFADAIGGETQRATIVERSGAEGVNDSHGCHSGCVIKCSRYWMDKDGHYKTKGPEYETAWSFGADCEIKDLDEIAELDRACGDLGLDTIEMGATLAVYMDSGAIPFGDAAGALEALRAGLDANDPRRIIWDGAEATGLAFDVARIPVVKHQALPAYDPRAVQGMGVTYATSTMGADHTAGYTVTANILNVGGTVDPLQPAGQAELSKNLQIATAMLDSLGFCIFVAFPVLDIPEAFAAIHEMTESFTGDKWDAGALMQLGREVLTMERLYNEKAGFTEADDRLPKFFQTDELPPHNVVFTVSDEELDTVFDFVPETARQMGLQ